MINCQKCGAPLPEEARFCHMCGALVKPPDEDLPEPVTPAAGTPPPDLDFVQPALTGGTFLGLLSSLPLLQLGNYLCCMWVIGGGSIATLLLVKQQPTRKLTFGDGAFVGVLSGLFGAVVATLVQIPLRLLTARILPSQQTAVEEMLNNIPGLEEPWRGVLMRVLSPEISAFTLIYIFISSLITFSLFAMIGGILTVSALNKQRSRLQPPRA